MHSYNAITQLQVDISAVYFIYKSSISPGLI